MLSNTRSCMNTIETEEKRMNLKFWECIKSSNITIRRRLYVTCVLLIAITMLTTLLCCFACVGVTVAWTRRTQTLSVMNNDDVLLTCRDITRQITDAISKAESSDDMRSFESLEERLSQDKTYVMILKDGFEYHSFGSVDAVDYTLQNAAEEIGESGYISSGNRQLYMRDVTVTGKTYKIYIFIYKLSNPYREVLVTLLVTVSAVALVFTLAFLFARKFLIAYVFAKIMKPLETLEDGVREIQGGNLGYQVNYEDADEFRSICNNFNTMSEQLRLSSDKLKHQEQNRKVLLASISHDLRSPITTISAYADGLLDGIAENPEVQKKYLQQISVKANEMTRMVNRLFMYSKMDMEEYPTYPIPLSLGCEIANFVDAINQEYEEKGLCISVIQQDVCPVNADPKQLHTVFANIIENSLRYKQKEIGTLTISVCEESNWCYLRFRDDGPGVAEEDIPKLFDVFFRSDPARKDAGVGSGLGLAIVSNAVKRADGIVTASNILPHGLEICIALPKGVDYEENTYN